MILQKTKPIGWQRCLAKLSGCVAGLFLTATTALASVYPVGVRTVQLSNPAQLDLTSGRIGPQLLTAELWYPAARAGSGPGARYDSMTKSKQPFTLTGKAWRDVAPAAAQFPLVVLSHGYPGNRLLMYYLAEHLAAHGYLVAAIDHPQSTYAEIAEAAPYAGFLHTLYHRARDQQFVASALQQGKAAALQFISGHVQHNNAAVIGYSMGGYGALNTIGGCFAFTDAHLAAFTGKRPINPGLQQALNSCAAGQSSAKAQVDPMWQAAVAIAPWGGQHQLFAAQALQNIEVPVLFLAGEQDEVSGYQGMRWLYEHTGSAPKYLLSIADAGHNIAPHPAPAVSRQRDSDFAHYHEPKWLTAELNDINRQLILLMLDCHLKKQANRCASLQLPPDTPLPGFREAVRSRLRWQWAGAAAK